MKEESVLKGLNFSYRDIKEFLLTKIESNVATDDEVKMYNDMRDYGLKRGLHMNKKLYRNDVELQMIEYYNTGCF